MLMYAAVEGNASQTPGTDGALVLQMVKANLTRVECWVEQEGGTGPVWLRR